MGCAASNFGVQNQNSKNTYNNYIFAYLLLRKNLTNFAPPIYKIDKTL